jgi:hypothetical protein
LPLSGGSLTGGITFGANDNYTSVDGSIIEMYSSDGYETYINPGSIELFAPTGATGTLQVDANNSSLL